MSAQRFTAAAVQFEPTQFEKERNIARLLDLVEQAAAGGAKLIVTPEMGTTGYCWFDRSEVAPFVEPIPGPTTERFAAAAQRLGCHIVVGMPEVDPATNLYYNSAVLIGPAGVIGRHRKSHPYISEPKWAASGDVGHQVFDTEIGRIALLICMDIHFIETARIVALAGADVICHISNWLAERTPAPYWISRAFENGCYLVESNRWGLERTVQFSGGSCVIGPDGKLLAAIDRGDGVAAAEIDLGRTAVKQMFGQPIAQRRRPEMYLNLATNTYSWNPRDFFTLYGHAPLPPGRASSIAVGQFRPGEDVAANLEVIAGLAREAAKEQQADLLVLPELCVTGPLSGGRNAEPVPGPATARLVSIALKHGLHLVAGLAEQDGAARYNTAVLVGPEGLVGSYRKVHLGDDDLGWASAGDEWKVFDLPLGRVGLLIGYDAAFPEAARSLSLLGCDLVACPAAQGGEFVCGHGGTAVAQNYPIPTGADPYHWHHYRVRAGENNVYFAFANVKDAARGLSGQSGVFGPDSFAFPRSNAILAEDSGVVTLAMDTTNLDTPYPTNVVRRKDLVSMRLPHHYTSLIVPLPGQERRSEGG